MPVRKARPSTSLPCAGLYITGKGIDTEKITRILGIKPSSTFARGDQVPGCDEKRAHALWALESRGKVRSQNPVRHLEWLLRRIDHARSAVVRLHKRTEMQVVIRVAWTMPVRRGVMVLDRKLVRRIARLKLPLEVTVCAQEPAGNTPAAEPQTTGNS